MRPLFRFLARTGLRESFTAAALLLVVGIALLMQLVGLSPALGTFLAGVVLADSEYRHELEARHRAVQGPAAGPVLHLGRRADRLRADGGAARSQIAGLVAGVMAVKLGVLCWLGRGSSGSTRPARWLLALALAQIGEFAFVLFALRVAERHPPADGDRAAVARCAISMAADAAGVHRSLERFVLPRVGAHDGAERAAGRDRRAEHRSSIAGYGRFGQIVGRMLRANGIGVTVLDIDPEQVDVLRQFGLKVFYGDASRLELLHAAGAEQAKVLVVAVDNAEKVLEIVHTAQKHFPNLAILARARGRTEAYELFDLRVENLYRETFDAALRCGEDSLRLLGLPAHAAHRAARAFRIAGRSVPA